MPQKPLAGVRVLEIGGYIALPYAASLMSALGADVVKVERPVSGDDFRRHLNERSPYFRQYNAGKRSLAVDLKQAGGVDLVKALIPKFDVVMENMRPGRVQSMGLGAADCRALRKDLVYASVTGFGNGGPLAQRPAYDTIGQSVGGLLSILSDSGAAKLTGTPIADLITGLTTVAGVLAALVGRGNSGQGQLVETSLMEAVSTLTIDAVTQYFEDEQRHDPARQSRHPQAQSFVLKTATGEDIAVHLSSSQKFWIALVEAMGRPDLAEDPRFKTFFLRRDHYFELVEIVEAEFIQKPAALWEKLLTEADVPFAPVLTVSTYLDHPQVGWLHLVEPVHDGLALVRPPWRFGGARPERSMQTPLVGQDSIEIASEVCSSEQVDQLLADGVLFAADVPALSGGREPAL